jgi:hypothetical protein
MTALLYRKRQREILYLSQSVGRSVGQSVNVIINKLLMIELYYQIDELCEMETEADCDHLRVVAHGSNESIVVT